MQVISYGMGEYKYIYRDGIAFAGIGEDAPNEAEARADRRQQRADRMAVLHRGRRRMGGEDQAFGIDAEMALDALDLLARVIARAVGRRPPFSADFTDWLSITAHDGLGSRPASSRART